MGCQMQYPSGNATIRKLPLCSSVLTKKLRSNSGKSSATNIGSSSMCRHTKQRLLFLAKNRVPVIISECTLPDADWKDILSQTALFPEPPSVIVLAGATQSALWAEAVDLGAFDVLVLPLQEIEVSRIVTSAWLMFQRKSSWTAKMRAGRGFDMIAV